MIHSKCFTCVNERPVTKTGRGAWLPAWVVPAEGALGWAAKIDLFSRKCQGALVISKLRFCKHLKIIYLIHVSVSA
jgi:hypothetical protein